PALTPKAPGAPTMRAPRLLLRAGRRRGSRGAGPQHRSDAHIGPVAGLDVSGLELGDRADYEIGPQVAVIGVRPAADLVELVRRRRYQQLEQELAIVRAQPSRRPREPPALAAVELRVAVGVVAHEHLGEVRVKRLDMLAELLPELEVELVLSGALDGHRQRERVAARRAGDLGAELLINQQAAHTSAGAHRRRSPA